MLTTQQKYKMLALAYSIKRARLNSVVSGQNVTLLYKQIGISCQTYHKYLNLLHKNGLTRIHENGSFQIKSWKIILDMLNISHHLIKGFAHEYLK